MKHDVDHTSETQSRDHDNVNDKVIRLIMGRFEHNNKHATNGYLGRSLVLTR